MSDATGHDIYSQAQSLEALLTQQKQQLSYAFLLCGNLQESAISTDTIQSWTMLQSMYDRLQQEVGQILEQLLPVTGQLDETITRLDEERRVYSALDAQYYHSKIEEITQRIDRYSAAADQPQIEEDTLQSLHEAYTRVHEEYEEQFIPLYLSIKETLDSSIRVM